MPDGCAFVHGVLLMTTRPHLRQMLQIAQASPRAGAACIQAEDMWASTDVRSTLATPHPHDTESNRMQAGPQLWPGAEEGTRPIRRDRAV